MEIVGPKMLISGTITILTGSFYYTRPNPVFFSLQNLLGFSCLRILYMVITFCVDRNHFSCLLWFLIYSAQALGSYTHVFDTSKLNLAMHEMLLETQFWITSFENETYQLKLYFDYYNKHCQVYEYQSKCHWCQRRNLLIRLSLQLIK